MYTRFFPERLDGFPFAGRDFQAVVSWAKARSDVRLNFTTADTEVQGVIEIYPAGAAWPRWCLWQTPDGRLQVDDLETGDWALPYPTVHMALRFIASKLLANC
jgi:hypothetical protein